MGASREQQYTPFGDRLHLAAEAEGTSVTRLGRESGFGPALHRYATGDRGSETLEAIARLHEISRKLHVNFEWLALGSGPMRRDGRGTTPAEEAIVFARRNGAREDAIQAAWEANREREKTWTVWEWVEAIDTEVRRLERAGIPRPEKVQEYQAAIARSGQKLAREKKKAKDAAIVNAPQRKRAVGDK